MEWVRKKKGPLLEGVFSTRTYSSLGHVILPQSHWEANRGESEHLACLSPATPAPLRECFKHSAPFKHSAARRRARKDNFMAKLVADGVEFDKQRGQARAATKNYKELYRKVRPSARSLRQTARAQHPPHTPSTACAQAKKKRLQRLDDAASPPMPPRPRCRP